MAETLAERMRRLGGGGESLSDRMRRLAESADEPRGGYGALSNAGRGAALGLAKSGYGLARGAAWLGDVLTPGQPFEGVRDWADRSQAEAQEFYNPQGTAGLVGEVAGRLLGEGATTIAGSLGVARGLTNVARGTGAVARAARPVAGAIEAGRQGNFAQRVAANVVPALPFDVALGAGSAAPGESRVRAAARDVAFDVGGSSLIEGIATALRASRGAVRRATDVGEGFTEAGVEGLRETRFDDLGTVPTRDPRRMLPGGPSTGALTGPGIALRGPESPDVRASIDRALDLKRLPRGPLITPPPRAAAPEIEPVPTAARDIKAARTPSGGLRDLTKVHNDALLREYADRADALLNAQERAQYHWMVDEGGHMGDPGRVVPMADRRGAGPSRQAKAFRNIEQIDQTMRRIEAEWARRGLPEDELYRGLDMVDAERRFQLTGSIEDAERAAMSSLTEPAYVPGDDEGFSVFERRARDSRDPAQAGLFDPRTPDAKLTHGSPTAAAKATEEVRAASKAFTTPPVRGGIQRPPTSAERLAAMRAAREAEQGWIDVRGKSLKSADDVHALMRPFRSPKQERMHVLLTDDAGKVLSHTMETSGAVNYVAFGRTPGDRAMPWLDPIARRARRVGATKVVLAHNHPSGNPTPSSDDVRFTQAMQQQLTRLGHKLKIESYVIDHNTVGDVVSQSTAPVRKRAFGGDWTDTTGPFATTPSEVARVVQAADDPSGIQVLYLDSQFRTVALEPHRPESLKRVNDWLPQRLRAHGAAGAIVTVGDDATYNVALRDLQGSRQIHDVIRLPDANAPRYESAREEFRYAPAPSGARARTARRVFEEGPGYGRGGRGESTVPDSRSTAGRQPALPGDAGIGPSAVREQSSLFGPGELPAPVDRRGQQSLFDDSNVGRTSRPAAPAPTDAEELRKLARRNERYADGDVVPPAEAEYRAADTEHLPGQGRFFSNPIGPAVRETLRSPVAGAVVGAGVGASADEENRLRGAAIGAAAGAGVGAFGRFRAGRTGALLRATGDADVDRVLGSIARGVRSAPAKDDLLTTAQKAYTAVVDELFPLRQFGRQVGGTDKLSELATQAKGWQSAAYQYTRDELKPVLELSKPVREQAMALAKAQRAIALLDQGLEKTDIPRDVLERTVAKLSANPEVRQATDALQGYYRRLLEYKAANGVLSPEQYQAILASGDFYTPFTREFEEGVAKAGTAGGGRLFNRGTGVRRMDAAKASAKTVDPFEQAILDTFEAHRTVAKQRVSNMVAAIVEDAPESSYPFIRRVANRTEAKAGRVVEANVGGERRTYEVIDEGLFNAWAAFDPRSQNLAVKILAPFKRALQTGVTILPDFAAANAIRDNVMTGIQYRGQLKTQAAGAAAGAAIGAATADAGERRKGALIGAGLGLGAGSIAPNIARTLSAMRHIVKDDAVYREFLREGGPSLGGFYPKNLSDARRLMGELERTGVSASDIVNPRQWYEALQTIGRLAEQAPRLAAYKAARAAGSDAAGAVARAADISLDFGKVGAQTKGIAAVTAFWNAKVQGWDKLARLLKNPKTWGAAAATVTAPSVALWTINAENPEYWERPQWERNLFWLVPKNGGGFWRIPKPFEVGFIFGSLPERVLDFAHQKDPETLSYALMDMLGNTFEGTVPLPTLPATIAENVANFDFFTRRPVVSRPDLPSELQFDERTSSVAKLAGQATGVSPQKIDNTLRDVTGGAGRIALSLADRIARAAGVDARPLPPGTAEVPVVGDLGRRFITNEGTTSDAESALWRRFAKAEASYRGALELEKYGTPEELGAYLREHRGDLSTYQGLKEVTDALRDVRSARRALARRRDVTPEQRERAMRKLAQLAQDFATRGVAAGQEPAVSSRRPR